LQRYAEFTPCNKKRQNNMKVNSPRVIINARIMANKKWKNITRGLLENFIYKVLALLNIAISPYERSFLRFPYHIGLITLYDSYSTGLVLNVSVASVWLHVCYTFNNSLPACACPHADRRSPSRSIGIYKDIFSFFGSAYPFGGLSRLGGSAFNAFSIRRMTRSFPITAINSKIPGPTP